ncbi:M23 family metallopeptidase [Lederbergia lenta]|uniref:Peptidase M23 n=1 Tax=Lederbergia lenta TaxID=1467 RepID=A0A2X4WSU6_LEDLE|nr:M23 family metallopeptidase [Lederbergia lenta]SQI61612.1 peptidase M23 [Lederbergia lenta]
MRKLLLTLILFLLPWQVNAAPLTDAEILEHRMILYQKTEASTQVPWYYIAAIDQFERSIRHVRNDLPKPDGITGYYITQEKWAGYTNPNPKDKNPLSIGIFGGIGVDGNGDGKADKDNDEDLLFAVASYISQYGVNDHSFRIALWNYYQRDKSVNAIMTNVKLFRKYNRIDLIEKAFPIPKSHHYSYNSTWGAGRGWGGRRSHEGTDIFASYGTPVYAVAYGVVELKGWNKFGGWRIGIRDINNTYHYYAHLNGFAKDINVGDIVEPGTVVGSVGSSGYGPPGTSGKFPPHLHFGMYKDSGKNEWSFDPFPHLKNWERNSKK